MANAGAPLGGMPPATGGAGGVAGGSFSGASSTAVAGSGPDVGGGGGAAGTSTGGGGNAGSGVDSGGVAGGGGGTAGGGGGEPTKKPLKVWLAGDSTMQSCSSACPCGWGGQFDKLFDADVTVVNRAVGGRSIQTWLYEGAVTTSKDGAGECALSSNNYAARWSEMLDDASGMQEGDYLFIQFGINDSTSECPRHVGAEKFKSYLGIMAKAAFDRGATPVLVTPVSSISCSGANAVGTRGSFVTATKTAATASSATLIDLHQLSVDRYTALGLCPNSGDYSAGKVGAFFCEDHTHFESAGAEEIAKLVAQAVIDAKLPLARYVLP